MRKTQKDIHPDEPAGAPEWMVTFSDCMTLLLTFFVLLLSFSSFDKKVFYKLKVIFSGGLSTVAWITPDRESLLNLQLINPTKEIDEGSEKPTLARQSKNNLKKEVRPLDICSYKIFLIPSRNIFWGKGTIISSRGRQCLSAMALLLKETSNKVVISENGLDADDKSNIELGLLRAWTVMKYFTTTHNLNRTRFSISSASTVYEKCSESNKLNFPNSEDERILEIILLERSIYN